METTKKCQEGGDQKTVIDTVGFEAGRLRKFVENWRNFTSDESVLEIVSNSEIEFDKDIPQKTYTQINILIPRSKKNNELRY